MCILICFQERGSKKELKVVGDGMKLTQLVVVALPSKMEVWMSNSDLSSLQRTCLTKINPNLISTL